MSAFDPTIGPDEVERRLRSWMADQRAGVDLTSTYARIVETTAASRQRPSLLVRPSLRRASPPTAWAFAARRGLIAVVLVVLLSMALVAGLLISGRLSEARRELGGVTPTGQLPAGTGLLVRPSVTLLPDGRVLIAGGTNYSDRGWAWIYDPETSTYGSPIAMYELRQGASATVLQDGRVLVAGGRPYRRYDSVASAELFDPATNTFTRTGSMAVARDGHTATLLLDGRVLVAGGVSQSLGSGEELNGQTTPAEAEIYDPTTGVFTAIGSMLASRAGHTATLVPDGRVVFLGGYGDDAATWHLRPEVEAFDPSTGGFDAIGELMTPREGHTATLLPGGRILVAGGNSGPPPTSASLAQPATLATAELFDPVAATAGATGPLVTERTGHAATLTPDGRVLISGGTNRFGSARSTEWYEPGSGTFTAGPAASSDHLFGVVPTLADGSLLLPGSEDGSELFDPRLALRRAPAPYGAHGPFSPVAMADLRSRFAAISLTDGSVLVVGGVGGTNNDELSSAELFDPMPGAFASVGPMAAARSGDAVYVGLVATRLPTGAVVIAGGNTDSGEVFDPVNRSFAPEPALANAFTFGGANPVAGLVDGWLVFERSPDDATRLVTGFDVVANRPGPTSKVCPLPLGAELRQDAVGLPDGRVLFLCGEGSPAAIFDPRDGSVEPAGLTGPWVRLVPLADGRILLLTADGARDSEPVMFRPDAIFDPERGGVTSIPAVPGQPGTGPAIAALRDGQLLLVGGTVSQPSDSAWLLDPTTGAFRSIGPMLAPRGEPGVFVLDGGKVLIVGGAVRAADRTMPAPPGAEVLDLNALP